MTTAPSLPTFLAAAMRDARCPLDERGLVPLAEARRITGSLTRYEKGESASTPVLGADLAWASLLSLESVREFLDAALRVEWCFHVRGHGNLAAYERYGDGILPWIARAVDANGTLRNVPWCLYPCLLAIETEGALDLAFLVQRVDASLEPSPARDEAPGDALGAAPAWLGHRAAERIVVVARRAAHDPRCRALLARSVAALGVASVAALRPAFGDEAAVARALDQLSIPVPRTPEEIEALLRGLPVSPEPAGPPWSVVELDQDDAFPYWQVLSGYETPYAIRVHGFASRDGDALFVQRICRDERASMPCERDVAAYGPGARAFDRRRALTELVSRDDVSGVELTGEGYVDGVSEVARVWSDRDAAGTRIDGAFRERLVRNPMPLEGVLVKIAGTEDDLLLPPQQPAAWAAVALRAASGDAQRADAMLRTIDPPEQVLFRLVTDHREALFLDEAKLRAQAKLPASAELLFVIDDPELPEVYAQRPPSTVAPWPLLCEALRRRVRLDPARVERVDVLTKRLVWGHDRGGPRDPWGEDTSPTIEPLPRGIGATPYHDTLLARGWPHGVRLLHQHPHNDAAAAVLDWVVAQPALPYRSYWPREIATRFVRHVGGAQDARDRGGWIAEAEAERILAGIVERREAHLAPIVVEHVVLLLEAFVGGPALIASARAIVEALTSEQRALSHPDGAHALATLGWVARRIRSKAGHTALRELRRLSSTLAPASDLGRGLDLALSGDEGVRRSARRPEDLALARDAELVRSMLGAAPAPLPLDLQLAVLLGEEAVTRWAAQPISAADAGIFATELAMLAWPSARALAQRLTPAG